MSGVETGEFFEDGHAWSVAPWHAPAAIIRTATVGADVACMIRAVPASIGQLFPSTDPLSRWMFSLSALTDDLAVLDHHLHQSFDEDPASPAVTYFRLIVARIYEGERIVTAPPDRRGARARGLAASLAVAARFQLLSP